MKARNNTRQEHKWDVTDFIAPKRICFRAWGMLTQLNVKKKQHSLSLALYFLRQRGVMVPVTSLMAQQPNLPSLYRST